jgi:DmsE family decaheme c-type cytochrome
MLHGGRREPMHLGRFMGGGRKLAAVAVLGLLAILVAADSHAQYALEFPENIRDAKYVGEETCRACHEAIADSFMVGIHGTAKEFEAPKAAVWGCESCHGPGSIHAEGGEPESILNPSRQEAPLAARLCLQCHRTGEMRGFEGTEHAMNELNCTSCHVMHGAQRSGLVTEKEPELCYSCHSDVKGKVYMPSRHPIREGHMLCSDCHNHHSGEYTDILPGERSTDLCLKCHASMQGPFVYEHAPVTEDCSICHDPHGAVANSMLKQNEPFLCLQCHQMHFHATLEGIEGEYTTLEGYSGISQHDSSKRAMLTKCTQCHSEIHGSDLPAQAISGQGKALTR